MRKKVLELLATKNNKHTIPNSIPNHRESLQLHFSLTHSLSLSLIINSYNEKIQPLTIKIIGFLKSILSVDISHYQSVTLKNYQVYKLLIQGVQKKMYPTPFN